MTDYIIMLGADYQAICDAVREKTGETDLLKSGDIAGQIQAIGAGGAKWKTIVEEQTISMALNSTYGRYSCAMNAQVPITKDMIFSILWDDVEYYSMSYDNAIKLNTISATMLIIGSNTIVTKSGSFSITSSANLNEQMPFQVICSDGKTDITICTESFAETHKFVLKKLDA